MINYAYWLSNIPGIGIRTRNRLIGAAGSAREIYGLTEKQLLLIPGVEEKHAAGIMESKKRDYDTEYESMAERGIFFLSREEQLFPQRLAAIPDAPYSLYVKGTMPQEWNKKTVAIVGARRCSAYGSSVAEKIAVVNPNVLETALANGFIPIVATVAQAADNTDEGYVYNINADTAAAKLAVALQAEKLILLTDVRGVLRDPKDEESLIHVIHPGELEDYREQGILTGGMIPKTDCCAEAVAGGVKRTHIIDGRIPHSILIEMLTDEGVGTMFVSGGKL